MNSDRNKKFLARYLKEREGKSIVVIPANSNDEFWTWVRRHRYKIEARLFMGPVLFIERFTQK